ncbi:hypothetical protein [Streptomyces sp. NBC_00829]|uniref:hypothetical protein n=1 Tax=Streptomyces sp. NBC_00829 TaxID=2903679 RepID=UPI003869082B|nr:hypothetical protein OG293_35990 [Streptomyces sp. NBC_00829]
MPIFVLGILLGALSGGGTFHYTGDPQLSEAAGLIAAVATWLGLATILFFRPDD